jgi:DNA repair exonuclease SbcCD ATPase subunit
VQDELDRLHAVLIALRDDFSIRGESRSGLPEVGGAGHPIASVGVAIRELTLSVASNTLGLGLLALGTRWPDLQRSAGMPAHPHQQAAWGYARTQRTGSRADADAEAIRLDQECTALGRNIKEADEQRQLRTADKAMAEGEARAACAQLSAGWQARVSDLTLEQLAALTKERDHLAASEVTARFEKWREDVTRKAEWEAQLKEVSGEIDDIPEQARLPAEGAQRHEQEAKKALVEATAVRDRAQDAVNDLENRANRLAELTGKLRDADRQAELHTKLDDLLGQEGLQRELVRQAEEEIIDGANERLQHLSDPELSLEPDPEGDERAFALRVRRAGGPRPTGVKFLSGSQKFRVAVSIALAIGRFAAGRARPLEGVIIDEGFGSLDKEGLRAMAEELKRLQRTQSLKRIILVSHQEEFTGQFPVGYRLVPGPEGATATPFRQ